jgi:hypothetical protein
MKPDEEVIGVASRIEYENSTGKLYIVFEIKNEKHKKFIKSNWTNDIECRIIDRSLVTKDIE